MAWRFRKSLKVAPGVRLNLNRKSASVSLGGKGLRWTGGTKGARTTASLPGTGLSFSSASGARGRRRTRKAADEGGSVPGAIILFGLMVGAIIGFLL